MNCVPLEGGFLSHVERSPVDAFRVFDDGHGEDRERYWRSSMMWVTECQRQFPRVPENRRRTELEDDPRKHDDRAL